MHQSMIGSWIRAQGERRDPNRPTLNDPLPDPSPEVLATRSATHDDVLRQHFVATYRKREDVLLNLAWQSALNRKRGLSPDHVYRFRQSLERDPGDWR